MCRVMNKTNSVHTILNGYSSGAKKVEDLDEEMKTQSVLL